MSSTSPQANCTFGSPRPRRCQRQPSTSPQANCTPALPPGPVTALREELRCLLIHPAITPERRQQAEPFLSQCLEVAKLRRWLELIVRECATWEEETLAAEEMQTKSASRK